MVCEDDCVFEGDGLGGEGVVEEDLVERSGQGEIEVQIVFAGEVFAD